MPMTYKRYKFLDGRLRQLGMQHHDLAYALNLSDAAMSGRFTGKTPWRLDEMYKVLDVCRAQPDELHLYFPRDGNDFLAARQASSGASASAGMSMGYPCQGIMDAARTAT